MYDHVLLPTDGSDGTDRAIDHALEVAQVHDATLHVLHVLDDASLASVSEGAMEDLRERGQSVVDAIAERARSAGVDARTEIREGSPHREILAHADAAGIDAIVMGTHGRSGVGRVLLGSVTERVVREAPMPVVTVRMTVERGGVSTPPAAERRAREALAEAGHEAIRFPEEPYRTTTAWVVPATTAEGTFNVHVDAADGTTRLARLDG